MPILTRRDGTGTVIAVTFDVGYEVTGNLSLSVTAETFDHDELARSIFGVAPVEERLVTGIEWTPGAWDADVTLAWIGERDLTRYGYEGYNDAAATLPKALVGDAYVTLDARVEYAISDRVAFYAGGRNLTDYNQAGDDDTPLFFGPDGAFDVGYIYAPLRGREMYAGFRAEF